MEITRQDILKVATLSRLHLTEEEIEMLTHDMGKIINFAHQLDEVDVDDVQLTMDDYTVYNVFRKDEVQPSMPREELLANAPESKNGCFFVPKVVE